MHKGIRKSLFGVNLKIAAIFLFLAAILVPVSLKCAGAVFVGVVFAHFTIISIWGTLVPGEFWCRWARWLSLLTLTWFCVLLWITIRSGYFTLNALLGITMLWSLGACFSAVPLKALAFFLRWQITRGSEPLPSNIHQSQFGLRTILFATLLIAILMAFLSTFCVNRHANIGEALQIVELGVPHELYLSLCYATFAQLNMLPCIWIALRDPPRKIKTYLLMWAVFSLILGSIEFGGTAIVLNLKILNGPWFFATLALVNLWSGGVVFANCAVLRYFGYRLKTGLNPT